MKTTPWDAADAELAAQLWLQGEAASMISNMLGNRYSRSAVLGKINRMRLARDPVKTKEPVKVKAKPDPKRRIRTRHSIGQRPAVIANSLKMPTTEVVKALLEMGLDPAEHDYIPYRVHPMWSMNEDDRRAAIYAKFQKGWADVLVRLAQ